MIIAGVLQGLSSKDEALGAGILLFIWILRLVFLALWITAIALAFNCSKPGSNKVWHVLGAFFFPEIYLIQYGVRKYVIKEAGYCSQLGASRFE